MKPVDWMLDYESGGKANGAPHTDPNDPGGATQWGISSRYYPHLAQLIRAGKLPRRTAELIYQGLFDQFSRYGAIDPRIQFYLFDRAVHGHLPELVRLIQAALSGYEGIKLTVDGVYGRATALALTQIGKFDLDSLSQTIAMIYPSWLYQWGLDTGHADGFLRRAQAVAGLAIQSAEVFA